ncbi:MAG: DUF1146 domain-containing protein [Bacilli bacterium]|nr:DUF1146 domain-containing protein [Bacilli bacterium]
MSYKVYVYAFMLLASTFALSGINFENVFKRNRIWEARVLVMLLIAALTYLSSRFIISFIEL